MIVTFPDAARRRAQSFPPPLRLEGEESNENMSHRNVWQVFLPSHLFACHLEWLKRCQIDGVHSICI
ncbi:hypothetical protein GW17_00009321 [Ensete ventricosum]|nr:hypothetical protein GW17_00009321 [Ensete ventricosum]